MRHPITIRASKSLHRSVCLLRSLSLSLSLTIGTQIVAGFTSCGLEEAERELATFKKQDVTVN